MGLFVTRTYTDGVLDTRGYKLRCFVENLTDWLFTHPILRD
jgi:hypothetical protein